MAAQRSESSRQAHAPTPVAVSAFKSRPGLARLGAALRYTWAGLRDGWKHEAAFRQEVVLCSVLLPVSLIVPVSTVERVLLIGTLIGVLVVELLNSAIEAVVDRVSLDHHLLSKRAKDLGSAAVFLSLLLLLLTWVSIVGPYVGAALRRVL